MLATLVGAGAGLLSVLQGAIARTLQHDLFGLSSASRLSALPALPLATLIVLPIGGLVLAAFSWATRARKRRMVDAVEANALHGGRMSVPDSLVISGQTMLSNGFGASVGLEAAYAQLGGAIGSVAGRVFNLRRAKAMKDALKELSKSKDAKHLPNAQQAIDKALKRGLIKRNTAARMKSRLAKQVAAK